MEVKKGVVVRGQTGTYILNMNIYDDFRTGNTGIRSIHLSKGNSSILAPNSIMLHSIYPASSAS